MGLPSFGSTVFDPRHAASLPLLIVQVPFFEILSSLKRALLYTVFEGEY